MNLRPLTSSLALAGALTFAGCSAVCLRFGEAAAISTRARGGRRACFRRAKYRRGDATGETRAAGGHGRFAHRGRHRGAAARTQSERHGRTRRLQFRGLARLWVSNGSSIRGRSRCTCRRRAANSCSPASSAQIYGTRRSTISPADQFDVKGKYVSDRSRKEGLGATLVAVAGSERGREAGFRVGENLLRRDRGGAFRGAALHDRL